MFERGEIRHSSSSEVTGYDDQKNQELFGTGKVSNNLDPMLFDRDPQLRSKYNPEINDSAESIAQILEDDGVELSAEDRVALALIERHHDFSESPLDLFNLYHSPDDMERLQPEVRLAVEMRCEELNEIADASIEYVEAMQGANPIFNEISDYARLDDFPNDLMKEGESLFAARCAICDGVNETTTADEYRRMAGEVMALMPWAQDLLRRCEEAMVDENASTNEFELAA